MIKYWISSTTTTTPSLSTMTTLTILLLLLLSNLQPTQADYVEVGLSQYPINNDSCPMGQLCDYVFNQSSAAAKLISACNASLTQSLANLNLSSVNSLAEVEAVYQLAKNCTSRLKTIFNPMTSVYKKGSYSAAGTNSPSVMLSLLLPGLLIFLSSSSSSSSSSSNKHKLVMLTITLLLLLTLVKAEGGDGGGGGHAGGEDGGFGHDEGGSVDHSFDEGAVKTADGHVEDGEVYYYGDVAVSSKSSRTSLYIIAFYLYQHHKTTINDTCLIESLSDFVQSETSNATDFIINFEMTLDSIYAASSSNNYSETGNSSSSSSYNVSLFHNFFNSLNSQTDSLINLCVTNSATLTVSSLGNMLVLLSIYFVSVVL